MQPFRPTLGIKETSLKAQSFVKENKTEFFALLKAYGPFLLAVSILIAVFSVIMAQDMNTFMAEVQKTVAGEEASVASEILREKLKEYQSSFHVVSYNILIFALEIVLAYITAAFAVSWHRLVLLGRDGCRPMALLKPEKNEIHFMLALGMLTYGIPMVIGFVIGVVAYLGSPALTAIVSFMAIIAFIVWIVTFYRFSFYFPGKAVGNSLTFKQSFHMTHGYVWKIFAASFLAILKTFGVLILCLFASGILVASAVLIISFFSGTLENASHGMEMIMQIISIPLQVYFTPLFTILGVTVLSNYYQHAVQNKSVPQSLDHS